MSDEKWNSHFVVFKLKSPLHIGYLPFKGSILSPTRYYIPGRTFWGAVTKKITEYIHKKPKAKDYRKIGIQVMKNFKFLYYYILDEKTVFLPIYTEEGLSYGNDSNMISKLQFECTFIGSRISTAIDIKSRTAKDRSLHEIEYINNKYQKEDGRISDTKIIGTILLKRDASINNNNIEIKSEGIFINDFNIFGELILGGESKYGFGHVLLDSVDKIKISSLNIERNNDIITISKNRYLPFHVKYKKEIGFIGNIELLTGRGFFDPKKASKNRNNPGKELSKAEHYFSPGTKILKEIKVRLDWDGTARILN